MVYTQIYTDTTTIKTNTFQLHVYNALQWTLRSVIYYNNNNRSDYYAFIYYMRPDFGKPTIYTQETYKIIPSNLPSLKKICLAIQPDMYVH